MRLLELQPEWVVFKNSLKINGNEMMVIVFYQVSLSTAKS